jgi:hypothetical protein
VKPDRTYLAVRRQLEAMGCDQVEVGIRDRDGRMMTRSWSKAEALKAVPWLKRQNALGADIYVRPGTADGQNAGLVLVDDVSRGTVERMRADGYAPAAVIETSPGNHQAWIRLSADRRLPAEVASEAARQLAGHYAGDPNSADWRHFGRLAGFTNQKPHHRDGAGRAPYVLAHDSTGQQAEAGLALLREVAQRQLDRDAKAERERRMKATETAQEPRKGADPTDTYRYGLRALVARYGASMDVSKADYMIGQDMARRGFSADQIGAAIEEASPELPTRKAGHEADYVARTVKAVMDSPKVQQWRQEQAHRQQQERDRDYDRDGPSL